MTSALVLSLMSNIGAESLIAADFPTQQEIAAQFADDFSVQNVPETDGRPIEEDAADFTDTGEVNGDSAGYQECFNTPDAATDSEPTHAPDDISEISQTEDLLKETESTENEKESDAYDTFGNKNDLLEPEDDVFETGAGSEQITAYTLNLYNMKETSASFYSLESSLIILKEEAASAKAPITTWTRKGYTFSGWNALPDGTGTTYAVGTPLDSLIAAENSSMDSDGIIELYGIWNPTTYKITYKLNKGKNNPSNPTTYTPDQTVALQTPTRSGYHFAGWYKKKNFKSRVTEITNGTTGNLTLYAKWIPQVKATSKSAKVNYCKGLGTSVIGISATIPKYVKSADEYYYLLRINPNTGKVSEVVQKAKKPEASNKKVAFKPSTEGHPEYIQAQFAIGVKKTVKNSTSAYTIISAKSYVSLPEKISANKASYFVPKTKKGIQSTSISEVVDTNSKTIFFNLDMSVLMNTSYGSENYTYGGKTYTFSSMRQYESLVSQCNAQGIQVTAQINLDKSPLTEHLIAEKSPYAETLYYGWGTHKASVRQEMEAIFSYLSQKFGRNDCYVSNWILGNEVNSTSHYYYCGKVNQSTYCTRYSEAFRCLYNAVRSSRASSKIFICLDNCWNQPNAFKIAYSSRSTLDTFAVKLKKLQSNVNWNVAYHAYSQPLTETKFWSSINAPIINNDPNKANFITMHNIGALTKYIKKNYGSKTRVILSEQGFSSSQGGEDVQAASMALAYYKAACDPMIDAFIIRSYQDQQHEVAQGLANGLKTAEGKEKTVFKVFKYMDGSKSLNYTQNVLKKQVGKKWKSQVPGYSKKRLYNMYRS